jgi:hypothetical protein
MPFFVTLVVWLFWCGWQRSRWRYFIGAGLVLGISQYIYVAARLLPLVIGLFALGWSLIALTQKEAHTKTKLKHLWLGLLVMVGASWVVFAPLGLFILNDSATFFFRSRDISIFNSVSRGEASALGQLFQALGVFFLSYSHTWRHNLVGESGFTWLDQVGLLLGLVVVLRYIRQPVSLLLLVGLGVMWLPAPLSLGISTLRLSGILPFLYLLIALGLFWLISWLAQKWHVSQLPLGLGMMALLLLINGGSTAYNYFVRWANESAVYHNYHGPYTDIADYIHQATQTGDILLPFEVYTFPTIRFMLYDEFHEVTEPPQPKPGRPLTLVKMLNTNPSALVWLTRDKNGEGVVYVGHPLPPDALAWLTPTGSPTQLRSLVTSEGIASLTSYASIKPIWSYLTDWSAILKIDYDWEHELQLYGYEIWPTWVQPGQSPMLNLYWRSLVGQPHARTLFIQLLNRYGEPVGQWTDTALADQHRWRAGSLIPVQHTLWMSPQAAPGPYLIRLGLFDYGTNQRSPIYTSAGETVGDQLILGLFYVSDGDTDPRQPQTRLTAQLGKTIKLLGYTLPPLPPNKAYLPVHLHWQATGPVNSDYTAFVQLLNEQGQRVTGWDSPPLNGQYPTSRWQPGEIVVDIFDVPLPANLSPGRYRVITGFYDVETGQRLPVDSGGDFVELTQFTLD